MKKFHIVALLLTIFMGGASAFAGQTTIDISSNS
jgi:hypothetical protein